jgi:hypothetical protein
VRHFILKERNIVLHRGDPNKNRLGIISGDVAQLADGRLWARWMSPNAVLPTVREYTEGEDPEKVPRPAMTDPWTWQRERFEQFNGGFHKWNRSADPNEKKRFAEQWPEVAAFLGVMPSEEHWTVELGDVYYPRRFERPRWAEYADRHAVGNLGLYGEIPHEAVDASAAWIISLQPAPIQARHALDTGRGVIRSRWVLPKAAQYSFPKSEFQTAADYTVDITTVHGPVGRRTLVEPVLHIGGITDESKAT